MKYPSTLTALCSFSRSPEFASWLQGLLKSDLFLSRRAELLIPSNHEEHEQFLARAEVYATFRFSEDELRKAPNLRWLHMGVAGVDSAIFPAMQQSKIVLTSSVGLHDETVPVAAWAFVLAFETGLHQGYCQKFAGIWDRKPITSQRSLPSRRRILIVGTGRIGGRIARFAKQAGMEVWGIRRSKAKTKLPNFDRVGSTSHFHQFLAEADYVVLSLPGGAETHHIIGAKELACMKKSAYLINMARGTVVDEPALLAALQNGTIAGAGLDVYAQEPLPAEHPFYKMANVAMTPHISGETADYAIRAAEFFLKNLRRYLRGQPLLNIVDKKRGY